ncbi:uncharacterized protein LOC133923485 [Phragmites australis]|uniref:uncharacterized protein LOC133923485 n=1 Tax=Phragmites australis TaxID=29695 RepID=UPI002D76A127|nr:uncharacterized protein LOC133923485 [Phragmites australis]
MPRLDLDHPFCVFGGAGESKSMVAFETAAALPGPNGSVQCCTVSASARADDADAPAESVLLRVPDGVCLAELFGAVLQRDGSTKSSSNPKVEAAAAARKGAPRANSRRLPACTTSKTAIVIGVLPAGKMVVKQERRAPGRVVARGWRRPAVGARVFASEAVGEEPVSPKVSCFGAVRSERRATANDAPPGKKQDEERSGCWASVTAALRVLCCNNNTREGESGASESNSKASAPESPPVAVMSPPRPVAGLGDVKRLASRRWPGTMAAEGRVPI